MRSDSSDVAHLLNTGTCIVDTMAKQRYAIVNPNAKETRMIASAETLPMKRAKLANVDGEEASVALVVVEGGAGRW